MIDCGGSAAVEALAAICRAGQAGRATNLPDRSRSPRRVVIYHEYRTALP